MLVQLESGLGAERLERTRLERENGVLEAKREALEAANQGLERAREELEATVRVIQYCEGNVFRNEAGNSSIFS